MQVSSVNYEAGLCVVSGANKSREGEAKETPMTDSQLEELHRREIYILDNVARVCKEYDLKYYLVGGSLLGAVRHKGFIPWDDDLDIGMPRKDYVKFVRVAKKNLGSDLFLQTPKTDKYYARIFAKVRINNTVFLEKGLEHTKMHHGIYIDIFPLDSGKIGRKSINAKIGCAINEYLVYKRYNHKFEHSWLNFFNLFPQRFLIFLQDFLLSGHGDYYINYGSRYGLKKQTIHKDKYDPPTMLYFEGKMYNVPNDYDFVLTQIYGNKYMELPPEEKRVTHNPLMISFDTTEKTIDPE